MSLRAGSFMGSLQTPAEETDSAQSYRQTKIAGRQSVALTESRDVFGEYAARQLELAKKILGGDVSAVEDACQEACKEILDHSLTSDRPIEVSWPYLRTATVYACYRELRRRHEERVKLGEAAHRYVIAEAPDLATAAMSADLLLTSDRIVRREFGSPYLDVFRLRYLDGLSVRQIAERLKLPISTVKKHNMMIIRFLRRTLTSPPEDSLRRSRDSARDRDALQQAGLLKLVDSLFG